jgi:CubicO group peptidase (beta-lactamase class C family)
MAGELRFIVAGMLLGIASSASVATPNQQLVGLWGSEQVSGPEAHGPLTIDCRSSDCSAEIAGISSTVMRNGTTVSFQLPNAQGEFRGHIAKAGLELTGEWLQPGRVPGTFSFLTPVKLDRVEPDVWKGNVTPLPNRLSLYAVVTQEPDGSTSAFIRSPEQNFGAHRSFVVSDDNGAVLLTNVKTPSDRLSGRYDAQTDRLTLAIPMRVEGGKKHAFAFEFTRRGRDSAKGFYPSTPEQSHYQYRPPIAEQDGWHVADLRQVGMDPTPITAAIEKVLQTRTTDSDTPYIQGLVVARHGKLVLEDYFYGFDGDRTHDLRSTGKSFTSALVGMAIERGTGLRLDTPVVSLFPEYRPLANPDPRKDRITIRDLLTMSSGLNCDDSVASSPGNEDTLFSQTAQPDYYKYTLDLPMARKPGEYPMHYCTAGINLLGGALRHVTGRSYAELFDDWIAKPLQFSTYHLATQPTKEAYGGGGLYVRPRDTLKLGQLYLDRGVWNGRRLLSANWIDQSTRRWTGYNAEHGYGFAWHLFNLTFDGVTYREYEAQGNGGQLIMVMPQLDLAVACVTGNYGDDETVPEREILGALVESIREKEQTALN